MGPLAGRSRQCVPAPKANRPAQILGVKEVVSMGYRAAELADVPFTTLRDRLMVYIRHYRPTVMFIPNPYTEYDRVLDRYYTGRAAEDAWRAASLENYLPPFTAAGLKPHLTPELYYYAQPLDPRRRDAESYRQHLFLNLRSWISREHSIGS